MIEKIIKILRLITCVALLAVIVMCGCVFFKTFTANTLRTEHTVDSIQTYREKYIKNIETKAPAAVKIDSLSQLPIAVVSLQQRLIKVESRLLMLEARQADTLNDVRQETNNNLDKINAWMAFWIACLAFIGVFAPLAIQYLNGKEYQSKFKFLEEQLKSNFSNSKTILQNKMSDIESDWIQIKKEWEKHNQESWNVKMQHQIAILAHAADHKLISLGYVRPHVLHEVTHKTIEAFSEIKDLIRLASTDVVSENVPLSATQACYLTDSLIFIFAMVRRIMILSRNNSNAGRGMSSREISKILDTIHILLSDLHNPVRLPSVKDVICRLETIIKYLRMLEAVI